jgi:cytochrome c oxidase assembly factor CtaG
MVGRSSHPGSAGSRRAREAERLQHASFLAGALLYWWSVLGTPARAAPASLFTTLLHTGALGALLALSPTVWYPAYADTAAARDGRRWTTSISAGS